FPRAGSARKSSSIRSAPARSPARGSATEPAPRREREEPFSRLPPFRLPPLQDREQAVRRKREKRGRHGPRQDLPVVHDRDAAVDQHAQSARSDRGGDRRE